MTAAAVTHCWDKVVPDSPSRRNRLCQQHSWHLALQQQPGTGKVNAQLSKQTITLVLFAGSARTKLNCAKARLVLDIRLRSEGIVGIFLDLCCVRSYHCLC